MSAYGQMQNEKRATAMKMDRRVRKIRRFFWNIQEDSPLFFWTIVLFLLGVLGVFLADKAMGAFR